MEYVILEEVRARGLNRIESAWGSLEDYLDAEWDLPHCEAGRIASWIYEVI